MEILCTERARAEGKELLGGVLGDERREAVGLVVAGDNDVLCLN